MKPNLIHDWFYLIRFKSHHVFNGEHCFVLARLNFTNDLGVVRFSTLAATHLGWAPASEFKLTLKEISAHPDDITPVTLEELPTYVHYALKTELFDHAMRGDV